MNGVALSRNGITISVQNIPGKKLPVLAVEIENENRIYKVATFSNDTTANWFVEMCEEFFKGTVKEDDSISK